ncbi:uncharacterized protein LOC124155087 [Ischnura elegans]|uniref:uncharacterized protein LOC124155087 n=1 Tax=Ischnura elegans TaxID=197161 RepID=UPI001ED8B715|nr:uncharacterized protein LOC124155087 [Ischnura elegans]
MPQKKSVRFTVFPVHASADDGETSGADRTDSQSASAERESTTPIQGRETANGVDQVIDEPLDVIEDEVVLSEHSLDSNFANRESGAVEETDDTNDQGELSSHKLTFEEERDGVVIRTCIKKRNSDICRICHEVSGSELYTRVRDVPHQSMNEENVRSLICLPEDDTLGMEYNDVGPLESPCLCKGTIGMVHRSCLERWLTEARRYTCELCGFQYETVRVPRLSVFTSFYLWVCSPSGRGKMFLWELLQILVIAPLTVGSTYVTMLFIAEAIVSVNRCLSNTPRGQRLSNSRHCTWWRAASFAIQSLAPWGEGVAEPGSGLGAWIYVMAKPLRLLLSITSTTFLTFHMTATLLSLIDHFDAWCRWRQADSVVRLLETPPESRVRVIAEAPSIMDFDPILF